MTNNPVEYNGIIIDITTMGDVICSIAAIEFNTFNGNIGSSIFHTISIKSCMDNGLYLNPEEINIWLNKNDIVRKSISNNKSITLNKALSNLSNFIYKRNLIDFTIYSSSIRQVFQKLEHAYTVLNLEIPWDVNREIDINSIIMINNDSDEFQTIHEKHSIDVCEIYIKYITKKINK